MDKCGSFMRLDLLRRLFDVRVYLMFVWKC